jgi:hypothetical protein
VRATLGICLIGLGLLLAAQAEGQGRFRITHTPATRQATSIRLDGQVFNDADRDALDVWVTAEALDARGKVVATGITFVGPLISGRKGASFVARIPFVEGVQDFRLAVTSYRDAAVVQSP